MTMWNLPAGTIKFKGKYYSYFDQDKVWVLDDAKGWILVDPPKGIRLEKSRLVVESDDCICTDETIWADGCQCGGK
jgi:hypothetical protein